MGIEWGTSTFRAWARTQDGTVVDRVERDAGILVVLNGNFETVF